MRARIAAHRDLNVFISETEEDGEGTVVAVKDLADVRGLPTTAASAVPNDGPAASDSPVISRLRSAGCVIIGKTNLHEWACGPTSASSHYGPVRNPHDPTRVAGGSSGGSAVAVALGMCDWALGTDTGGSIRIPAALTGVVGIKPTHGLVSTERVIPFARSLDTVGPLAPSVEAALRALEQLTGGRYVLGGPPPAWRQLRVGVPAGWVEDLDEVTATVWDEVAAGLPHVPFPARSRFAAAILPIMQGEGAAYHRVRLARHGDLYQPDVRAFMEDALKVTAAEYLEAVDAAAELRAEVEMALTDWDALLLPATAITAPKIGEDGVREPLTRFTRPFNLTGHPAIAVPIPWAGPMPAGVQVVGRLHGERALGRVALALEAELKTGRSPGPRESPGRAAERTAALRTHRSRRDPRWRAGGGR